MKIYTYYEDINYPFQKEILKIWQNNWSSYGFEPIILSEQDAKKSHFYEEFYYKINSIHEFIADKKISGYGINCYLRWIAYSALDNQDPFLVSDYDVVNQGFVETDIKESLEKISFLDGCCPCVSFGRTNQYLDFAKDIIYISENSKKEIKEKYKKTKFIQYHDQEFLAINRQSLSYNICKPGKYVELYMHNIKTKHKEDNVKLFHVAHKSAISLQQQFPVLRSKCYELLRLELIKFILNL